jgi:sterol-4alpha-carboxylate 3-dehydrogenase (decarboxylating)
MDHYLIIGGAGFLGRAIATMCLQNGSNVSIFDIVKPKDVDPRIHCYIGDITKPTDIQEACKGKSIVIHTASPVHGKPAAVYFKVNVEGTNNVIQACLDQKVRKLIYTSSASVIYNGQDLVNADETTPYCTVHMDAYNETKALAEQSVLKANCKELATCAIRPSGIFGPGYILYSCRDQQGIAIAETAKSGKHKFILGNNTNLFDITFVENAAYAHVLAAQKVAFGNGIDGQAFLITNDQPIFFWDYPKLLWHYLGYENTQRICLSSSVSFAIGGLMDMIAWILSPIKEIHPTFTRFRVKIILGNRYFNINKAKTLLGYKPIVPLIQGLQKTAEYWKTLGYGN